MASFLTAIDVTQKVISLSQWVTKQLQKKHVEVLEKKAGAERYGLFSTNQVSEDPCIIMGDRGNPENGFREEVYFERDIDGELREHLLGAKRTTNIVIITGRYTNGKSRAIQQFIFRERKSFDRIFKPNPAGEFQDLMTEVDRLPQGTLIVLDDINEYWARSNNGSFSLESVIALFAAVNDRNLPCIATISNGAPDYREFYDKVKDNDEAKGRHKEKSLLFVEIEDIRENDEIFMRCTSNFRNNVYAKAVGGYIPELTRHVEVNLNHILDQPEASIFLAAFLILNKFRKQQCTLLEKVNRMYEVIVRTEKVQDVCSPPNSLYDHSLDILFSTGFLLQNEGRRLLQIDDTSLYRAFRNRCAQRNLKNPLLLKYLSGTKEAELNQICRLVEMDGEDPEYYARAITKCSYFANIEKVTHWIFKKFFDENPLQVKAVYLSRPETLDKLCATLGMVIGRSKNPIPLCEKILASGITPDICLVSELLRAANTNQPPQEKHQIIEYALALKERYRLNEDMYFLHMMEACDTGYDTERARKVADIYRDSPRTAYLEKGFQRYCKLLAQKADSADRMDEYFQILRDVPTLSVNPRIVNALVYRINGRKGAAATSLFKKLADHLLSDDAPEQIDIHSWNSGILSILRLCKDVRTALDIYHQAASVIQESMDSHSDSYLEDVKVLSIMALYLARLLQKVPFASPEYLDISRILEECIQDAWYREQDHLHRTDPLAAGKFFNALLNNQPASPDSLDGLFDLYGDKTVFPGDRDINTFNSMAETAIRSLPALSERNERNTVQMRSGRCKDLENLALRLDQLRKDGGLSADGRYYLFLFRIMDNIQHTDSHFDTTVVRNLIDDQAIEKNEILKSQEVKLTGDRNLVHRRADECERKLKQGIIQMDLINHLLGKFCDDFHEDKALRNKLDRLVANTKDEIQHSVHDYQHYLEYLLATENLSLDEIIDGLYEAWKALQRSGFPLREKNGDILCTVIKAPEINMEEAIYLVDAAIEYDRLYRSQDMSLFHFDTLAVLASKYRRESRYIADKKELSRYADEIQRIVDSLTEIGYEDELITSKRLIIPVKEVIEKKQFWHKRIRIPFESTSMSVRHNALLTRIAVEDENDGNSVYCSDYELKAFVNQELFAIRQEVSKDLNHWKTADRNVIEECLEYLLLALRWIRDVYDPELEGGIDLQKINEDKYLKAFMEKDPPSRFLQYDNFFQGYLGEGYVPEDLREEWMEMERFFFPTGDSVEKEACR